MMKNPIRMILWLVVIQLLQCTQMTSFLENLPDCQLPTKLEQSCSREQHLEGISLICLGLNSTSDLTQLEPNIANSVIKLDISGGFIPCLELEDFSSLTRLEEIRLTNCKVKEAICGKSKVKHMKAAENLKHLHTLDLSHNYLTTVDESLLALHKLETINLSHNHITHIKPVFSAFKQLKSVDISHNKLSFNLNKQVFKELPPTLNYLDITGNPWPCTPTLSWMYPWSLSLPLSIQEKLNTAQCNIENSPTHQHSPLLTVMQYYSVKVTPQCPDKCSCHFYHFAAGINTSPTYTVIVNCSSQNLTSFPSLPQQTTVLDLSHNLLSQDSYDMLDVVSQNYLQITSLVLSHNYLTSLGTKLLKMNLHRSFQADHNALTDIPYDFSLLLQKYDNNQISLGGNLWRCTCNSEITDSNLLEKLQDLMDVICDAGSVPHSIVGRKETCKSSNMILGFASIFFYCPRTRVCWMVERSAII